MAQHVDGALVAVERLYLNNTFTDTIALTISTAIAKDLHYTLFRYEDWPAWVIFTVVFIVLIIFDNVAWSRYAKAMTLTKALLYTFFWVACAGGFCGWVYCWYGPNQAFMWMSGYMLEWMLSFDNLFVFHMIFAAYGTPDHLKHRPLYLGICGAIIFRLVFIFVGEYLMHSMYLFHFIFGSFLIYTGVKTATMDDDDEDPSQQPLVQWLQRKVPFVSCYDDKGAFFVRVPVDSSGEAKIPSGAKDECSMVLATNGSQRCYGTVDFSARKLSFSQHFATMGYQTRATMLFLVVCCLEISDVLFAVDSVSAIVAQVNDLFLAYTSTVFAMLGLRAGFFVIDVLAQLFSLLKYGVAAVLVFIGVKLIGSRFYHVPPGIVCVLLVSTIGTSMIASVIKERMYPSDEDKEHDANVPESTATC